MSEPKSVVYIVDVDLNPRYDHTIYFADPTAQENFFMNKVVKTFMQYTFIRKTWSINVEATLEQARAWSYLFTRNHDSGLYNYYFIVGAEYVNDYTVRLDLELDVMQTYMFTTSLTECFVEREHASTDQPGENLVDEGLEVGELICRNPTDIEWGDLRVLVMSTVDLQKSTGETKERTMCANYNGIYWGAAVYAVDMLEYNMLGTLLADLDAAGNSDCVVNMWMYPSALLNIGSGTICKTVNDARYTDYNRSVPDTLGNGNYVGGNYEPRNKKLLTYPYNMLYVTNNAGGAAVYHFELFKDSLIQLRIYGTLSPEGGAKLVPLNYKGAGENVDEALSFGTFPTCSWNQDVYKLWVAQNQNQRQVDLASGAAKILGGVAAVAMGGPAGLATGAAMAWSGQQQIKSMLAQERDMAIQPPQAKGSASPSANVTAGCLCYTVMQKCITADRARILDDFFDMYGYKTMRVKVPNKAHRQRWWYTKTIGCHVVGAASAADLAKIEAIYDRGITFWRDGNRIGNYTDDNIISI